MELETSIETTFFKLRLPGQVLHGFLAMILLLWMRQVICFEHHLADVKYSAVLAESATTLCSTNINAAEGQCSGPQVRMTKTNKGGAVAQNSVRISRDMAPTAASNLLAFYVYRFCAGVLSVPGTAVAEVAGEEVGSIVEKMNSANRQHSVSLKY